MEFLMGFLLVITALFMILLVLVQRGRGGGLAGAFGGMGGNSAFGTKAGDMFTRITIGVAAFWILLCIASIKFIPHSEPNRFGEGVPPPSSGIERGTPRGTSDSGNNSGTSSTDKNTGSTTDDAGKNNKGTGESPNTSKTPPGDDTLKQPLPPVTPPTDLPPGPADTTKDAPKPPDEK